MASSRKPAHRADPSAGLTDKVAQALQAGAAFVVSGDGARAGTVAVALSGGRDSVALLHALRAAVVASSLPLRVVALHVHHGLQAEADQWDVFCATLCADWQLPFYSQRVSVSQGQGEGLEAAARRARYAALESMCDEAGAALLLFAHHLDDQVETVLLRLFRGAGLAGLGGMPRLRRLGARQQIVLLRPWLEVGRDEIDAYCAVNALPWIDDPSNDDSRFARNALRQHMPALAAAFPALRANVAQAAAHLAQASELLDALATQWMAGLVRTPRDTSTLAELDLAGLRALPPAEADAVLRLWLRELGTQAPSTARLSAMRAQLIEHEGGEPAIQHETLMLHRFRGRVLARRAGPAIDSEDLALHWQGEARLAVPAWHGELRFTRDDTFGLPEAALRRPLRLAARQGGERIVLRPGGPARALKQGYQEAGVPMARRARLPLLWSGDQLVFAAGLGMHRRWPDAPAAPRWRVEWVEWVEPVGSPRQGAAIE
ncbi:tRNA lysidine(34) synthetase TilS [Cupriavidus sp. YAF13]|uniref:tRNA lysidine(34) synthetase TilS n=1 Tax=Cupriavidus sp. YAF13 TaxID=3233075 RepID=UPI003F93732C